MRKVFFLLLFSSFLLNAHPPKSIDLSYDGAKAALTVKVWHKVSNPENHYVKKITVFLGNEPIAEKTYERQQAKEFQEEIFALNEKHLKNGDPVKVRAFCSVYGEKTVDLVWQE
ncbi:MAG: hypothetical protein NTZ12_11930 [Candidatus Aminicenantes bacterium]|nr:hypothetical protein [Candidatus Aminicenantes bacterium]